MKNLVQNKYNCKLCVLAGTAGQQQADPAALEASRIGGVLEIRPSNGMENINLNLHLYSIIN